MPTPTLITAHEAAIAVGVSPRTIRRWADTGRLRAAHKLPGPTGAYLFDARAVKAAAKKEAA